MTTRPTWPEYFQQHAALASSRATCPRAACGAVIVKDRRIIATGYNGAPSGHPHCTDVGCEMADGHCQRVIHAEVNAIGQAAQLGIAVAGATMYIHRANVDSDGRGPCRECCKVMKAAGIWDYYTENGPADMRLVYSPEAWGITHIRPEGCEPGPGNNCCRHGDCKNANGCCEHGHAVSTRLSLPSDIALADVPDHNKIGIYGTRPAEEIRDMLAKGWIRKVMHNGMVYGYLSVHAVPINRGNHA